MLDTLFLAHYAEMPFCASWCCFIFVTSSWIILRCLVFCTPNHLAWLSRPDFCPHCLLLSSWCYVAGSYLPHATLLNFPYPFVVLLDVLHIMVCLSSLSFVRLLDLPYLMSSCLPAPKPCYAIWSCFRGVAFFWTRPRHAMLLGRLPYHQTAFGHVILPSWY